MAVPFVKIVHEADSIETELQNYLSSLTVSLASESKKNTTTLTLRNPNGKLNTLDIDLDDDIVIYLDTNPIVAQDPLITAVVSSVEYSEDGKKTEIRITAVDKTYLLLSKLWGKHYPETENWDASEIIINVLRNINDGSFGDEDKKLSYTNVATTKKDGSAFPSGITMTKVWKPFYEWITDLSTPEYTGEDRNYVFYIDQDNDLHWQYPMQKLDIYLTSTLAAGATTVNVDSTSTYPSDGVLQIEDEEISYTGKTATSFTGCTRGSNNTTDVEHASGTQVSALVLETGKKYIGKLKLQKDNDKAVNFIIYNAGPTPEGFEYLWYQFDEGNADKEFRMTKKEWKDIGKSMKSDEYAQDSSKWDERNPSNTSYPNAYPWTTSWGVTTASDSEYEEAFLEEMVKRGTARAQNIFSSVGSSKYKASIDLKSNFGFRINDQCTVISTENGISKKLRIKEIQYQLSSAGLGVSISLGEDEDAVTI